MELKRQPNSDASSTGGTRFVRKLHMAFGALLLVTLALAWYFYDSVEWYEHDVRHIALNNQLLQNYQSLSNQTWRLLSQMDGAVSAGATQGESEWQAAAVGLQETSEAIRRDIGALTELGTFDGGARRIEQLDDVERVIDEFLAAGATISRAVADDQPEVAAAELGRLRQEGLVSLFDQMTTSVIADQGEVVQRSQAGAMDLAAYITGLLPVVMIALILITLFMMRLFSGSLTRSVKALHDGASAFSAGSLEYRIPQLKEVEFRSLGTEFNNMASELAEHRVRVDEAKVKLEAMVEERTRALQVSNQKLETIDENRRQLLADISHEFRTPLTVILGEAEIALRSSDKKAEPYRESLQRIVEQVRHTTRLVDDLLFIARAEVGEPRLSMAEAPVAELLNGVCESFTAAAKNKSITFTRDIPEIGPVVTADAGRLRQVFSILVDNAVKYSNEGGEVDVGLENGANVVTVTVCDRGIGLSEEDLRHVFTRYYRSRSAERHDSGTGLGLPVAKAIVEAHGGEIALEPREGGGIRSTVSLPMNGARSEAA